MRRETAALNGLSVEVITLNTAVVGSGAAGLNAALRLHKLDCRDIALITEGMNTGTSRNTGSDKQTYYKLTLCGDGADSPMDMARDLFNGKCVDGDVALAEAALSVPCFLQLTELGVPFPVNRYGEYAGYKTDHDPRARATSAGPLTSRLMTERLEEAVRARNIPVFDGFSVIAVLTHRERAAGLLCLCRDGLALEDTRFVLFNCRNIVYATGGPAGIYADSVYPSGHNGGSGVALEAGVAGKNLTEWQYGLASTAPRWNVSGTYMQVLPRFVSVDSDGSEREFLNEYYPNEGERLSMVFQKGYEWPFDSRKATTGSSVIDLLVYRERVLRGRRVFLDFRSNPGGRERLDFAGLSEEAREYLSRAGACFGTPLERLLHMNEPAYDLYLSKGVDLRTEMLEIALCAQHHNGGLAVDMWWRTNLPGFYAAGEAAGTHGVCRPGGSALNAGQVGALRAAQHIAAHGTGEPLPLKEFLAAAKAPVERHRRLCRRILEGGDTALSLMKEAQAQMTATAGAVRTAAGMETLLRQRRRDLETFAETVRVSTPLRLPLAYRLRDILICQRMVLAAMTDYLAHGGGTRGSALYAQPQGEAPAGLEDCFRFLPDTGELDRQVQELYYGEDECRASWREVRGIPRSDDAFETVWREYRIDKNVR